MNLADLPLDQRPAPRFLITALTYHPEIGTFRGKRGAWRVHHCFTFPCELPVRAHRVQDEDGEPEVPMLYMPVPRPLKPSTFVNPTKLLRKVIEQRRLLLDHQLA